MSTSLLRLTLRAAVLVAGAILMALEILAFRVISKSFGSALRETSAVIAVFLAAMSLGYYLGGRVADRRPSPLPFLAALGLAGLLICLVPSLDPPVSARVFASRLPLLAHAFVVTLALFAVPVLLLASISPIAIRLLGNNPSKSGTTAGSVAALSTIGSILGCLATGFFLIDLFHSIRKTLLSLGLGCLFCAALTGAVCLLAVPAHRARLAGALRRHGRALALLILVLLSAVPALLLALLPSPVQRAQGMALLPGQDGIRFEGDSPFHHILVEDRRGMRYLHFDNTNQSAMRIGHPLLGGFHYTEYFHVPMVAAPVRRVLFIGMGGGSAPKRFLHDYPEVQVDVVEIDPAVVSVARRFFAVPRSPRLRVFPADGRLFLRRGQERYDVIFVDAYAASRYGFSIPAHLATREFFAAAERRLTENGVLVYNCAALPRSALTRALSATLGAVLPAQIALQQFPEYNTVLIASRRDLHLDPAVLAARLPALGGQDEKALLSAVSRDGLVLSDDYAPLDTLGD